MKYKNYLIGISLSLTASIANSQDKEYTNKAIKIGIGVGLNETSVERGFGLVYNLGYQTQFGKSDRLRINPNLLYGGFLPVGITDTRDQFYRISSLSADLHGDVLRLNSFSLVLTIGAFLNYSRGLLGTGGDNDIPIRNSSYFNKIYSGTKAGIGFRVVNKTGAFAYEFKPINVMQGNHHFTFGYLMFGMDINLRK